MPHVSHPAIARPAKPSALTIIEQTLSPPLRLRGGCEMGGVYAPCRFGLTEAITDERMTTRDSGCRSCWSSRRGEGGLARRPQGVGSGRFRKRQPTTIGRSLGPISALRLGGALCLVLPRCDGSGTAARSELWANSRGLGGALCLVLPRCVGPGFPLRGQGWFRPSEPRWTPGRHQPREG